MIEQTKLAELLPCPLCGGKARTETIKRRIGVACLHTVFKQHIICTKCKLRSKVFRSPGKAASAWNTRPALRAQPSPDNAELIERLRAYRSIMIGGHPSICDEAAEALARPTYADGLEDAAKVADGRALTWRYLSVDHSAMFEGLAKDIRALTGAKP